MINCCYAYINRQWSERELSDNLMQLPERLCNEALAKRQWTDRQLNIAGKLLLKEVLQQFEMPLSLSELEYNTYHRPYFDTNFDFNIAHSGNLVTCCGTDSGNIGIDIEQIKAIELNDYTDYFTGNEWLIIRNYPDILQGFYDFWTRKESVLKAIGTGFHTPLSSVDVTGDVVEYDAMTYHIRKLNIDVDYPCHIAATTKPVDVKLLAVSL